MTDDSYPVRDPRSAESKRTVARLINERNPGLRQALRQLESLMGSGNRARANVPFDRAENRGTPIEDIATAVAVFAGNSKGVRVLHKVIAYGIEEYLDDDRIVCLHCEEPIDGYRVTAGAAKGKLTFWHRATGNALCLDGEAEAEPLKEGRRGSGRTIVQVTQERLVPGGFSG